MTFKIRKLDYRAWPVTVSLQECDDNGAVTEIEQTFVAHWKPVTEADRKAIEAEVDKVHPLPKPATDVARQTISADPGEAPAADGGRLNLEALLARNADYFARLVVGWGPEVKDDAGQPVPFDVATLKALITGPDGLAFSTALVRADNEIRYGLAPAKNFKPSPAHGDVSDAGAGATNSPTT